MRTDFTHDRPRGRTLHLIDLENLAGSPYAAAPDVEATLEGYRSMVSVCEDDHAVATTGGIWPVPRWCRSASRRARRAPRAQGTAAPVEERADRAELVVEVLVHLLVDEVPVELTVRPLEEPVERHRHHHDQLLHRGLRTHLDGELTR
jgi:hypothetical protein